jgi:O-acetyl-ADP-ribose deacetylase (regulator of RNase III)
MEQVCGSRRESETMITYVDANLFTSPAQTLVNTVNTVGVMGKGIAKAFKTVYPDMFEEYASLCRRGEFTTGRLLLYRTHHKWVLNFPTKRHWRQRSRLEDIDAGLRTFRQTYAEQGITSVAFPQLGCGNGGLDWERQVRPLMEQHLATLPIDVTVHVVSEASTVEVDVDWEALTAWLRGNPQMVSFSRLRQDLGAEMAENQWSGAVADGAKTPVNGQGAEGDPLLDTEGLFTLWRRLRSFGYLVPEDVVDVLAMPAEPILVLLAALPYITRGRAARAAMPIGYDAPSTSAMLDAPEAYGVRIVLPLAAESAAEPLLVDDEGDGPCRANRMTSQLALFSTS